MYVLNRTRERHELPDQRVFYTNGKNPLFQTTCNIFTICLNTSLPMIKDTIKEFFLQLKFKEILKIVMIIVLYQNISLLKK